MQGSAESQYLLIAEQILRTGEERPDRTGTGTWSLFSPQDIKINLKDGFPLLTTKKISFKNIAHELFWILNGDTNIKYLNDHGVNIWNEWADQFGSLGRIYGAQLRQWERIPDHDHSPELHDQIQNLISGLIHNPFGRRHIATTWNVGELDEMRLPPCHGVMIQCYISKNGLSLKMHQRSADWFLGVPYNIASYALLTHLIAYRIGKPVDRLILSYGDAHIYKNHEKQMYKQIEREPLSLPTLEVNKITDDLKNMQLEYITLKNYLHHPAIRGKVSV